MSNTNGNFTWVQTHKELVEIIAEKENQQKELIELLKNAGVTQFNDRIEEDEVIDLEVIDPFTFFCYINKYGSVRKLKILREIAKKYNLSMPTGDDGLPSAQAQRVWLFPYKRIRTNNEISRLWAFFRSALEKSITEDQYNDILTISNVGQIKITEALFYIDPDTYLPINGPTKPFLNQVLGVNPTFKTWAEYLTILDQVKKASDRPFYEVSREAWVWLQGQMENKKYWLYSPGESASKWDEFYDERIMCLGWDELGDLNDYKTKEEIADKLREIFDTDSSKKNDATANWEFKEVMSEGDVIIAKHGRSEYLGYGVVVSDYFYDDSREAFKKTREVDWKTKGIWEDDKGDIVLKTLTDITKYPEYVERLINLIGIETPSTEISDTNISKVDYPLNTIFYGPPGTGKTYKTIHRAAEIVEGRKIDNYIEAQQIFNDQLGETIEFITFHQNYSYEDFIQGLRPDVEGGSELSFERVDGVFKVMADKAKTNLDQSRKSVESKKSFQVVFNTFTAPLIEGEVDELEVPMMRSSYYITLITTKSIEFRKSNGNTQHSLSINTLKRMYEAESVLNIQGLRSYYSPLLDKLLEIGKDPEGKKLTERKKNFVIIIDEINRANISRVFGELITLIEPDKRSEGEVPLTTTLPSGESFVVPSNLYLIGTMNTADKSIAQLDIALRRRFDFEAMYPLYEIKEKVIHAVDVLKNINKEIISEKGHDFQIGHSYFMGGSENLVERMNRKVIPLLLEYFMNDDKQVSDILRKAGLKVDETAWPLQITGRI